MILIGKFFKMIAIKRDYLWIDLNEMNNCYKECRCILVDLRYISLSMKTVASLGLIVLLLSHSMGWSVAVLFAGKTAGMAAPNEAVQSEASAWHRFAELSERIQEMQLAKTPLTPLGSVLKTLGDLAKAYLPGTQNHTDWVGEIYLPHQQVRFAEPYRTAVAGVFNCATPPPEMIG
jgi:hypothetical protein